MRVLQACKTLLLAVTCVPPGTWAAEVGSRNEVLSAAASSTNPTVLAAYQNQVSNLVRQRIVFENDPEQSNLEAVLLVSLLPGREVTDVRIQKGSGNSLYDQAVMRALVQLGRFPVPPDSVELGREVIFHFRLR